MFNKGSRKGEKERRKEKTTWIGLHMKVRGVSGLSRESYGLPCQSHGHFLVCQWNIVMNTRIFMFSDGFVSKKSKYDRNTENISLWYQKDWKYDKIWSNYKKICKIQSFDMYLYKICIFIQSTWSTLLWCRKSHVKRPIRSRNIEKRNMATRTTSHVTSRNYYIRHVT